jgi:hypothetical protein
MALLSGRGEFEAVLENFRIQFERAKTKELQDYWRDQIRYAFSGQVLKSLQQSVEQIRKETGNPPGEAEFPNLKGCERLRLRPVGRSGKFTAYQTVRFTLEPVGSFPETILYDAATGNVFSLFRVRLAERDIREGISWAVAGYRQQRGLSPPPGKAGIDALLEAGFLRRNYPHPLDGGYVLDEKGAPISEMGWERFLDGLEEAAVEGK